MSAIIRTDILAPTRADEHGQRDAHEKGPHKEGASDSGNDCAGMLANQSKADEQADAHPEPHGHPVQNGHNIARRDSSFALSTIAPASRPVTGGAA